MSDLHSLLRKGNTETVSHFLKSCSYLPKRPVAWMTACGTPRATAVPGPGKCSFSAEGGTVQG